MGKCILGVDAGGSKTLALISDHEGNVLGRGLSGRGNYEGIGIGLALQNIRLAIENAMTDARITSDDISFVQYALAGADRPKDFAIYRDALKQLPFQKWDCVNDTMPALRLGSPRFFGVVLVCGTGFNAAGRSLYGKTVQVGGTGHLFGDGPGGSELARETFRHAARSWDHRAIPSILPNLVSGYFGFGNMGLVIEDFLDRDVTTVPNDLSILLHDAARDGDLLAIGILEHTGYELGIAANAVVDHINDFGSTTIPIILTGSVLQKGRSPQLLKVLEETIRSRNFNVELVIPDLESVFGSLMLGMDALGIEVTQAVLDKFYLCKAL